MKKLTILLLIVLISLILVKCDNSTKSTIESQTAYLNFFNNDNFIEVSLGLFNDPMTSLNYLSINNEKLKLTERYNPGSIYYYNTFSENSFENGTQNLDIKIKTDLGTLAGTITIPDSINIGYIPDSINYGEDIVITWTGNADYYNIYYFYDYIANDGNINFYSQYFGYITENSIALSNDHFNSDGVIFNITIYPINGIIPKEDTRGNMIGDGAGFINYYGDRFEYDNPIIVGNGINYSFHKKIVRTENVQNIQEHCLSKMMLGE